MHPTNPQLRKYSLSYISLKLVIISSAALLLCSIIPNLRFNSRLLRFSCIIKAFKIINCSFNSSVLDETSFYNTNKSELILFKFFFIFCIFLVMTKQIQRIYTNTDNERWPNIYTLSQDRIIKESKKIEIINVCRDY